MSEIYTGFPPVFDQNAKALILGSFPSVKSREISFYYGNRQNRFWKTLQDFFGGDVETTEDKKRLLLSGGIALWDIVERCTVDGSKDSSIKVLSVSDLNVVFRGCDIRKIYCNGATSYRLTEKYFGNCGKPMVCLPSTSPANVRFDAEKWRAALCEIRAFTAGQK